MDQVEQVEQVESREPKLPERVLQAIKDAGDEGISSGDLAKVVSVKVSYLYSILSDLKMEWDIRNIDFRYFFKGQRVRPHVKRRLKPKWKSPVGTVREKILQVLRKNPEGLTSESIEQETGLKKHSIQNAVYALRRQQYDLFKNGDVYCLAQNGKQKKHVSAQLAPSQKVVSAPVEPSRFAMSALMGSTELVKKLPEAMREDYYFHMQRAVQSRLCAEAIVEAHTVVMSLKQEVGDE